MIKEGYIIMIYPFKFLSLVYEKDSYGPALSLHYRNKLFSE